MYQFRKINTYMGLDLRICRKLLLRPISLQVAVSLIRKLVTYFI